MKDQSLQELVDAYCEEPTQGLRHAIITKAMPLLKSIIGKIPNPNNTLTQYEDLENTGIMGLLQALDNYDSSRDVQFSTFAYYRIRGNIIDYLRSVDELPRNDRSNYGKARQAISDLQQKLGRKPSDEEVAEELDMSLEKYRQLLSNVQRRAVLSIDKPVYGEGDGGTLGMFLENKNIERPDAQLDRESVSEQLEAAIENLKERDRLILALYYYEDLTLNEIAILLGLTEARISQIVGELLLQLKNALPQSEMIS
ncbi:MAG TPA: FliA/WhiG family RNA polymerase sigma factor [Balneolaceae bacterium]|nr:FliA/WhiG family RNA polymerase sigma factor [Balneolaceae bacterium]